MNVTLKSGTNELHGAIFEILQNKQLDANRWENNSSGTPRGQFEQNQFGAAVGGPIIKNRTFIFGDYQGTRIVAAGGVIQNLGNSGNYTIPTQAMIGGNFSALPKTIYDPASTVISADGKTATRTPFSGNMIPTNRMDAVASKIAALYPATNQPLNYTSGYPQNDYFVSTAGNWVTDQGDVRVDHRLSDKDSLFGTLSWSNTEQDQYRAVPGRARRGDLRRRSGTGPEPQRDGQLDTRLDSQPHLGNAPRFHAAGDFPHSDRQRQYGRVQGLRDRRL